MAAEVHAQRSTMPVAEAAHPFFENYLRLYLQTIAPTDVEAAYSAWDAKLDPCFLTVGPCVNLQDRAATPGSRGDVVVHAWREAWRHGAYASPSIGHFLVQEHSPFCIDCTACLQRQYRGKARDDTSAASLSLTLVHVRATAARRADGQLRVVLHCYTTAPPECIHGIPSHSQIGQDLWVVSRLGAAKHGFFLDIGANHAQELSNTFLLERGLQWQGVCVDPFPQGDWSLRGSSRLIECAIGRDGEKVKFVAPGHVLGGIVDSVDLARVQVSVPADQLRVVEVETRSILSILGRGSSPGSFQVDPNILAVESESNGGNDVGGNIPKVIHYLSLDTEGSEYDILCQFPFERCRLLAITVEHNYIEPNRSKIRSFLESKGYFLDASVEHDDFYLLHGFEKFLSS